jgi:hypothetical protein
LEIRGADLMCLIPRQIQQMQGSLDPHWSVGVTTSVPLRPPFPGLSGTDIHFRHPKHHLAPNFLGHQDFSANVPADSLTQSLQAFYSIERMHLG